MGKKKQLKADIDKLNEMYKNKCIECKKLKIENEESIRSVSILLDISTRRGERIEELESFIIALNKILESLTPEIKAVLKENEALKAKIQEVKKVLENVPQGYKVVQNNVFSDDVLKRIWDHYGVIL